MGSLYPGAIGAGLALVVAAAWCARSRAPVVESAAEATVAVRITKHDALGMPSRPASIREPARVRAVVEALGVDAQPSVECPPDYASAELGIHLSGRDVYARRDVYVWGLFADAGGPNVVVVSSSGCRGGPPADASALRREILASDAGL